ncbi:MAG: dicarboxylate/amino acid:cation symporter [Oleispira antarctica]|uniref:Sodium:dicarboxylate symporter n=1 Tax=Oleispira antarctica RB-8 TaxID=698738 RepID=R4YJW3_OLEAN|nr:dicarboxylate/amino acid:cation symporter [Oleispira antarctica]MBQ0792696.1 dicarboxylate/amino acid:cation symporter [Oleispira antarctica]CCK74716.1 Sodium:dicarboxylate symporter [Oleispira antarctica RB-8]
MKKIKPLTNPLKNLVDQFDLLIRGRLWLKVLIALALGVAFGVLLGPDLHLVSASAVKNITSWLALPGQVFLAIIQMIVVPLVMASIVLGLAANNNPTAMKKNGFIAIIFIVASTAVAAAIGIFLALNIQPGNYIDASSLIDIDAGTVVNTVAKGFPEMSELPAKVSGLIPKNPLASMASGEMLQVILFSAVLGAALLSIPASQSKPLFDLLVALQEVSLRIVSWAMLLAPIAVFGLITRLVANLGIDVLTGMAIYVFTVLLGLLIVALLYFLVAKLTLKHSLKYFFVSVRELLLLAFSTSSSAAVMPITLQVTEEKLNIKPEISRFLVPLGATINMTGTALYQGVATVFLAQVFNVDLSISSYVFIVTMAVAASIGSPATPGAGIIILSMVLEGVGIPAAGIALILGVDRILDMCRTSVNVLGDVVTCSTVQYFTEDDHEKAMNKENNENKAVS